MCAHVCMYMYAYIGPMYVCVRACVRDIIMNVRMYVVRTYTYKI